MDINNYQLLSFLYKKFGTFPNFSFDDYLHAFGKGTDALFYSVLFCPDFIEIENRIFLKRNIYKIEEIKKILTQAKNFYEIEKKFNFVEIGYLFDCIGRDLLENEEMLLAVQLKNSWEGQLKLKFPNRKFIVDILSSDETGSTIGIQFYEVNENE